MSAATGPQSEAALAALHASRRRSVLRWLLVPRPAVTSSLSGTMVVPVAGAAGAADAGVSGWAAEALVAAARADVGRLETHICAEHTAHAAAILAYIKKFSGSRHYYGTDFLGPGVPPSTRRDIVLQKTAAAPVLGQFVAANRIFLGMRADQIRRTDAAGAERIFKGQLPA